MMNTAFTLIWIAGIIIGFCVLFGLLYSAYKITEARGSATLMDAEFPIAADEITKKTVYKYEDFYSSATSDARIATGCFYTDSNLESMRRKYAPQKILKGRN